MNKVLKFALLVAGLYGANVAGRFVGYIIGTIDTLGAVNATEYERELYGMRIKLTKLEEKA